MKPGTLEHARESTAIQRTSRLVVGLTFRDWIQSNYTAQTATIPTPLPVAVSKELMVSVAHLKLILSARRIDQMCWPYVGAFFGTTFVHLLFQTFRELAPAPYCPPAQPIHNSARSPGGSQSAPPQFFNPNPHGGQKAPAGRIYIPKIYGFRVSERARSGPRMHWLRLRPETAEELEHVDSKGRWIDSFEFDDESDHEDRGRHASSLFEGGELDHGGLALE